MKMAHGSSAFLLSWCPKLAKSAISGGLPLCRQVTPRPQQVAECGQDLQAVGVFLQAAIAHLPVAERALDQQERMFNLRPDTGLGALGDVQRTVVGKLPSPTGSHRDLPLDLTLLMRLTLVDAAIARVGPHGSLLAVQQPIRDIQVMHIGRRRCHAVDHTQGVVHPDMHLHSKMPLVAFLGLMHLGVAPTVSVLGRTGCRDDRRVNDGAFLQHQTFSGQVLVDGIEDDLTEPMSLEEVAEVEDRGFVRNPLRKPKPRKDTHRFDLVQRVFHRGIAEVVEQLQAVHTQHRGQWIRWTTRLTPRVVLAQRLLQLRPWNQLVHAFQEHLTARFALLVGKLGFRKGHLGHGAYRGVMA
jgi:hypothetical protein